MKKLIKNTHNKLFSKKYFNQLDNIQKQISLQLQKNKKTFIEHSFLAKDKSIINVNIQLHTLKNNNKLFKITYSTNSKHIQENHPVSTISTKIYI